MKYACIALVAVILVLGGLYFKAASDFADAKAALAATKNALAAAEAVNVANQAAITRLEASARNTDKILADWDKDRTTLAAVRSATRQTIVEAMRDETFKAWAAALVPADAWRLLSQQAADRKGNENGSVSSAGGALERLPGNADPGQRHER